MAKRRFIAGAVCPRCGALDRLVIEEREGDNPPSRRCVACGFVDVLRTAPSRPPKNRLDGGLRAPPADEPARVVKLIDPKAKPLC